MKETIETWARVRDGQILGIYGNKEGAKIAAESFGGTVVKLTGEMPRVPIERKTVAWVQLGEPQPDHWNASTRLGVLDISEMKSGRCQHKVEIIVRTLPEEG